MLTEQVRGAAIISKYAPASIASKLSLVIPKTWDRILPSSKKIVWKAGS